MGDCRYIKMNTYKLVINSTIILAISNPVHAFDPAAIDYDGINVTPVLEVAGTYDDNYKTLTAAAAQSSWITTIAPGVQIVGFGDKSTYTLDIAVNYQVYEASNAKNLTNLYAKASANFEFDVRNRLDMEAGYSKTESVANTFTPGVENSFTQTNIGASYTYGAPSATGNIELGFNNVNLRSNNGANPDQERDSQAYSATFVYRVTDKTKLTAEIDGSRYDYVSNTALNSTNIAYLIGARWEATAKTNGRLKIGSETKDFDDSKPNANLTTWEISADWSPLTYSTFTFTTNQKIDEGSFGASYTDSTNNILNWQHDWGRGYTSQATISSLNSDYSSGREDTTTSFGVGLKYEIRRWADIAFDYQHSNRDSNVINGNYDRNIYKLTVNIGL